MMSAASGQQEPNASTVYIILVLSLQTQLAQGTLKRTDTKPQQYPCPKF